MIRPRTRFLFVLVFFCALLSLLAGCNRDPNVKKQKYLESGKAYYEKGRYREAAIQFQNADANVWR